MKRFAAATLLAVAVVVLAGCSEAPTDKPVFGQGEAPAVDDAALAKAKAGAGIEDCAPAERTKVSEDGLPDLILDCFGGGDPVNLAGIRGPAVINLWASWCKPCKEELPLFAKAHRILGDRMQFVGIDFADDAPDAALELVAKSGVTYPQLADPTSTVKTDLKVVGLPQTVFVDRQGTIVATERRAFRSYSDLTAAIKKHLGVTP